MLSSRDSGEVELPPPAKLLVGSLPLPLSMSCDAISLMVSPEVPAWALFDKPKVLDRLIELFGANTGILGTKGGCTTEFASTWGAMVKVKSWGADFRRTASDWLAA